MSNSLKEYFFTSISKSPALNATTAAPALKEESASSARLKKLEVPECQRAVELREDIFRPGYSSLGKIVKNKLSVFSKELNYSVLLASS